MSSSIGAPERNALPSQSPSASFPGNTGAADSSQPSGFKKFFSRTRNIVLLSVATIIALLILSVAIGSGLTSGIGDSGDKGGKIVPDTPPPRPTEDLEQGDERQE